MKRKASQQDVGEDTPELASVETASPPPRKRARRPAPAPTQRVTRAASRRAKTPASVAPPASQSPRVSPSPGELAAVTAADKVGTPALNETTGATPSNEVTAGEEVPAPPTRRPRGRPPSQKASVVAGEEGSAPPARRPRGRPPLRKAPGKLQGPARVKKAGPRAPGRRKRQERDAEGEADLQRQAELRKSYRELVQALKPSLDELAERTTAVLQRNPASYRESETYPTIKGCLDSRLEQSKKLVEAQHRYEAGSLQMTQRRERLEADYAFVARMQELRDQYRFRMQQEIMRVRREQRQAEDQDATDDEEDPATRAAQSPQGTPEASRSVGPMEAERTWQSFVAQPRVGRAVSSYAPAVAEESANDAATADAEHDEIAIASQNIQTLIEASEASSDDSQGVRSDASFDPGNYALQLLASVSESMGYAKERGGKGKCSLSSILNPEVEG